MCTPASVGAGGGEGGVAPPTQLERVGGGVGEGTPQSLENKEQRK